VLDPRLLMRSFRLILLMQLTCGVVVSTSCHPQEDNAVNVAVAANFTEPAREIAKLFEQTPSHKVALSFGSTGQLFTQITQDAPFEVFLSADEETPKKVVAAGLGVQETLFTYAVGKVVLFSPARDVSQGEAVLRTGAFQKIAVANPSTAPYGAAAIQVIKTLGLYDELVRKIVQGNNITQAFQFVESGNAEVGFVALSQVVGKDRRMLWVVPDNLYSAIRQDAVLLNKGADNGAARAFMAFLRTPQAVKVIEKYGYETAPGARL
jgi:molybdate transport system substrate-binding protein